MQPAELLKKVQQLELKSKKLTSHLFGGEYKSAFKGRGMAFKEVKEYAPEDDIRFIDWNVSARMGNTYTKVFEEEREWNVFILADISASTFLGGNNSKQQLITELSAVLAFSAAANNDKTGMVFCSGEVEKYIPSAKGKQHILYMLRELLQLSPQNQQTELGKGLQFIDKICRHKSIIFILSDFADKGYETILQKIAAKHDVVGIKVYDTTDFELPKLGLVTLQDAETGSQIWLNTNNVQHQKAYRKQFDEIQATTRYNFKMAKADLVEIATNEDYVPKLQQFFLQR